MCKCATPGCTPVAWMQASVGINAPRKCKYQFGTYVVKNCDVILVFNNLTSQIEFGTYESSFGTYGSKYQIWYLARLPIRTRTEGHLGHVGHHLSLLAK